MKRKVWYELGPDEHNYVHRCSVCGRFKKRLWKHWFFTGLYCIGCIHDLLWNNARTMEEVA